MATYQDGSSSATAEAEVSKGKAPDTQSVDTKAPTTGASSSEASSSSSSSSSQSQPTATPAPQVCSHCKKAPTDPAKPLKPCPKCQSEGYCSRDCQKAGWKTHKKVCAEAAQKYAMTADLKMATPQRAPKDGFRGGLQKWQFDT